MTYKNKNINKKKCKCKILFEAKENNITSLIFSFLSYKQGLLIIMNKIKKFIFDICVQFKNKKQYK